MSVAELLADLSRLGVRLKAHGDRLRFHPRAALTTDLLSRLKEHKVAVIAAISENPPSVVPPTRERDIGPRPCPSCGCAIYWQSDYGGLACAECFRRPVDAVRRLVVIPTDDGRNEWADYEAVRRIMTAK